MGLLGNVPGAAPLGRHTLGPYLFYTDVIVVSDIIPSTKFFLSDTIVANDAAISVPINTITLHAQSFDNVNIPPQIKLVQDDTAPVLGFSVIDTIGNFFDLASATATLKVSERDTNTPKIDTPLQIVGNSLVSYRLQAADTDTAGQFWGEIEIDFGDGLIMSSEKFLIRIRGDL
jgi:hypothetical protein